MRTKKFNSRKSKKNFWQALKPKIECAEVFLRILIACFKFFSDFLNCSVCPRFNLGIYNIDELFF